MLYPDPFVFVYIIANLQLIGILSKGEASREDEDYGEDSEVVRW